MCVVTVLCITTQLGREALSPVKFFSQTLPTLPTLPYSDIAVSLWGAKKIEAPNRQ
jgi:hypothetical protein